MNHASSRLFQVVYMAIGLAGAGSALAAPISIFGTGLDNEGNPLPANSVDSHYTWAAGSGDIDNCLSNYSYGGFSGTSAIVPETNYWGGLNVVSFSAAAIDNENSNAAYTYRTTFDLTGLNAATASIYLHYYADDGGEIALNGTLLPSTFSRYSGGDFTLSGGFINGLNTLDFVTFNEGGPGGLFVHIYEAVADEAEAPEPASLALLSASLAGLGLIRRKRT